MNESAGAPTSFRRSSYCHGREGIEVGRHADGRVLMRSSSRPELQPLAFSVTEWAKFVHHARSGHLDLEILTRELHRELMAPELTTIIAEAGVSKVAIHIVKDAVRTALVEPTIARSYLEDFFEELCDLATSGEDEGVQISAAIQIAARIWEVRDEAIHRDELRASRDE